LVKALGLCAGGVPFLVEPVQVRFVIGNAPAAFRRRMMNTRSGGGSCRLAWPERSAGNPFLDGLPGWLDGLHGFDIEGRRWRAREMDDSFPEAVEAEEEFDFALAHDLADGLHGALAA